MLSEIQKQLLAEIADLHKVPEGAYNIRANGESAGRNSTANIDITSKTDKPGIDITIKPGTRNESVHIPVVLSESGLKDVVYNDFYVGDGADVVIVAGCGISTAATRTPPTTACTASTSGRTRKSSTSRSTTARAAEEASAS